MEEIINILEKWAKEGTQECRNFILNGAGSITGKGFCYILFLHKKIGEAWKTKIMTFTSGDDFSLVAKELLELMEFKGEADDRLGLDIPESGGGDQEGTQDNLLPHGEDQG